jgi:4-amino-4-deoxy-L-arabinose transferase-like glycosyltransferase
MDPGEISAKADRLSALTAFFERLPGDSGARIGLLAVLAALFAIANTPWHLDNYDQAKQAFVSYEIVKNAKWWHQTTPAGRTASKPPLAGWLSATVYLATGWWDLAWRLPGYVCAVVMLGMLAHEGGRLAGGAGVFLASAAYGLNLLTPRLATLVRTDMMLAFWIFLAGWMIYRKVESGEAWMAWERTVFLVVMTAALFTKGPVIYAFLLPGMAIFALFAQPRERRLLVWCGWWPWLIPLGLFLVWTAVGIATDREFYEDVIQREFLSRFEGGARSDERPQPWWFYFPHVLHKFAPWSVLLLALPAISARVRERLRRNPGAFWLLVWSVGGLLLMTVIPAKRVDRIYPIIPPMALLVVAMAAAVWEDRRMRVTAGACAVAALVFSGGYFLGLVPLSYWERTPALVEFAAKARATASERGVGQVEALRARDEGLLLYLDQPRFLTKEDGFRRWESVEPCALLMSNRTAESFFEKFGAVVPALDSGELRAKNEKRYLLFLRE